MPAYWHEALDFESGGIQVHNEESLLTELIPLNMRHAVELDSEKASLMEMGLPYELKPVDTRKGEQHAPAFLAVNPNGKVPAIVDQEAGARVFDSNAILLYLAEKTGRFLPESRPVARGELLSSACHVGALALVGRAS